MTISKIIAQLQALKKEYGDLEVSIVSDTGQVLGITWLRPGNLDEDQDFWPDTLEDTPDCKVNHVFFKAN